ncbi:hypothetical protein LCGC14_2576620 [marine sediment metagenome]|uniref:DUF7694 domain-containing protein n=1 Tax=marine sediment metagenome TaxID=412755 RepID=A0A0F9B3J8_9ZZZZ
MRIRNRKRTSVQEFPEPQEVRLPSGILTGLEPGSKAYEFGECHIIVGRSTEGWHLSISCPNRYPTWDEVAHARYSLIPNDVTLAMLLPPKEEYVNVHDFVFHLWQIERDQLRPFYGPDGAMIGWQRRAWG